MTHFGILCPNATGHLNPMMTLGNELQRRGHRVTLFGVSDARQKALAAGLGFCVLGELKYPIGSMARVYTQLGELDGFMALRYTIEQTKQNAEVILTEAPKAIHTAGVEALLVDQATPEGSTVADVLNLPFITICCALMLDQEPSVPPAFASWKYNQSSWAYLRNRLGHALTRQIGKSIERVIARYRQLWGLPAQIRFEDTNSRLAQISQQPVDFEYPRTTLPPWVHFVGPLLNPDIREPISFPFETLSGQPLIYASLGTIQNRMVRIFQSIAAACVGIDAQLVISLGGSASLDALQKLPGSPLVRAYAPQLKLLPEAVLTITHAGMNTTLESLSYGVPMVAIPITNDQPGVAARIAWTGTGEVVQLQHLDASRLRTAINRVLTREFYKNNALRLQAAIHQAGGVKRAADIVEQAISTGKPVLRDKQ